MKELRNKEVIIIAGPSASGKSYLMRQLINKKNNKFKEAIYPDLNIKYSKPRSGISISALKNLSKKPEHSRKLRKKIIFIHFDLTSRQQKEKRQLLLLAAKNCKRIKVLTVKTPFNTWRERMQNRIKMNPSAKPKNDASKIFNNSKYFNIFAKLQYILVYREWARFISSIEPEINISFDN